MDNVAQTQHVIEWFGMRSGVFLEPKKTWKHISVAKRGTPNGYNGLGRGVY